MVCAGRGNSCRALACGSTGEAFAHEVRLDHARRRGILARR